MERPPPRRQLLGSPGELSGSPGRVLGASEAFGARLAPSDALPLAFRRRRGALLRRFEGLVGPVERLLAPVAVSRGSPGSIRQVKTNGF